MNWLDNEAYKNQLMERIGDSQYQSSYTKKIAIYTYLGLLNGKTQRINNQEKELHL